MESGRQENGTGTYTRFQADKSLSLVAMVYSQQAALGSYRFNSWAFLPLCALGVWDGSWGDKTHIPVTILPPSVVPSFKFWHKLFALLCGCTFPHKSP